MKIKAKDGRKTIMYCFVIKNFDGEIIRRSYSYEYPDGVDSAIICNDMYIWNNKFYNEYNTIFPELERIF